MIRIPRWWSKFRQLAAEDLHAGCCGRHSRIPFPVTDRLLHTSACLICKPHFDAYPAAASSKFAPLSNAPSFARVSPFPLSLIQVRNITAKQKERKLKSRKPMTPVISKVKKIKIKCYSSFKGRFRLMKDGQIRRWKEGKRHNAHLKSKKSKRRLRQPGVVPLAYAKVMKKLNFCA